MDVFTTVPLLFGIGINIWLGLILLVLITFQIYTGLAMRRGIVGLLRYHRFNAGLIVIGVVFHAYYGIGIWFFGFKYGG